MSSLLVGSFHFYVDAEKLFQRDRRSYWQKSLPKTGSQIDGWRNLAVTLIDHETGPWVATGGYIPSE